MNAIKQQCGFTLVEIQISLFILLLISAILMSSLTLAKKVFLKTQDLSMQTNAMRVISPILNKQINGIIPLRAMNNGQESIIFKGNADDIYYVAHLPQHAVGGGPWLIHLFVKNRQLLLEYKTINKDFSNYVDFKEQDQTILLLNNVSHFSLSYFDDKDSELKPLWVSGWRESNKLPSLVKIRIQQDKKRWPDSIIPLFSYQALTTNAHKLSL